MNTAGMPFSVANLSTVPLTQAMPSKVAASGGVSECRWPPTDFMEAEGW